MTRHDSNGRPLPSLPVSQRLKHFTWSWFECTMSTGALATLLAQLPSHPVVHTIGLVLFIINLVLFFVFSGCIFFRFVSNPGSLSRSLHHPHESFYFGTLWVSIALILYGLQLYVVPVTGEWMVKTLEIAFWTLAGMVMLVAVFQYHVIFDSQKLPVMEAMPAWILPVYPFLVLGPLAGALLKSYGHGEEREHGWEEGCVWILLGGVAFQGLGWCVAFFMYTVYVTRLINSELPKPSKKPGMFVAVGPAAYTSDTFVALATQAPSILPKGFLGVKDLPVGDIWKAIGVPCGIFLWLLSFWFCALSSVSVLSTAKDMYFTMNWWALIFPNVGLTIAFLKIGEALESNGIVRICTVMTVVLVIGWVGVAGACGRAVWRGDVMWPGLDEDSEDIEGQEADEGGDGEA